MGKLILGFAIATIGILSVAGPSQAHCGCRDGWHHRHVVHCWTKRKAKVDYYGNVYFKRVRLCR